MLAMSDIINKPITEDCVSPNYKTFITQTSYSTQVQLKHLTNMYYSQSESSVENEAGYDSDSPITRQLLMQSPTHKEFYKYLATRRREEVLHDNWKLKIRREANFAQEVKEQCGMMVRLAANRVYYIYEPMPNETRIPGIEFKIAFNYIKLLRKWYISLGRSHLPDVINLGNRYRKKGTHDPTEQRVIEMVCKVKSLLELFVQRLDYIHGMIDNAKESYKDIEFQVNKDLITVQILLKDTVWPISLAKTCPQDIINLNLKLDRNFKTDNVSYKYSHSQDMSVVQKNKCLSTLHEKLKIFTELPLVEAFATFMN